MLWLGSTDKPPEVKYRNLPLKGEVMLPSVREARRSSCQMLGRATNNGGRSLVSYLQLKLHLHEYCPPGSLMFAWSP